MLLRGWRLHPADGEAQCGDLLGGNARTLPTSASSCRRSLPHSDIYMLAYRGYGASEGEPTQELMELDAAALFDEVRRLHPRAAHHRDRPQPGHQAWRLPWPTCASRTSWC